MSVFPKCLVKLLIECSVLIISFHLCLCFPSGLLTALACHVHLQSLPSCLVCLLKYLVKTTNCAVHHYMLCPYKYNTNYKANGKTVRVIDRGGP
jgi:hypothetical protein